MIVAAAVSLAVMVSDEPLSITKRQNFPPARAAQVRPVGSDANTLGVSGIHAIGRSREVSATTVPGPLATGPHLICALQVVERSFEEPIMSCPWGVNDTITFGQEGSGWKDTSWYVLVSQTQAVAWPYNPPLASNSPSAEKATLAIAALCSIRHAHSSPLAISHTRTVLSHPPLAGLPLSGENATLETRARCPLRLCTLSRGTTSQTATVWSPDAVANILPSAENATSQIGPLWPWRQAISRPFVESHNLTVESSEPLANCFPSGENLTQCTGPSCPIG